MRVKKIIINNLSNIDKHLNRVILNKQNLYDNLLPAIAYGIENDLLQVPLIYVKIKKEKVVIHLNLYRELWELWLNIIMDRLIEDELYEKCHKVKLLLKKLQ